MKRKLICTGCIYIFLASFILLSNIGGEIIYAQDSKTSKYYVNTGNEYGNKGNYSQAIACYNKAVEIDNQNSYAYYNRGVAYGRLGNYDQALADYNKAYQLNPRDGDAMYNAALIWESRNNYSAAENYMNAAAKADPRLLNDQEFNKKLAVVQRENLRNAASTDGADVAHVLRCYKTVSEWRTSSEYSQLMSHGSSSRPSYLAPQPSYLPSWVQ